MEKKHSTSHNNNPTCWRKVGEGRADKWFISPSNFYNSPEPKKEMLYVPFENGLTMEDLVDSGAYLSEIAKKELDRIKLAPANILKLGDPRNYQIEVANG